MHSISLKFDIKSHLFLFLFWIDIIRNSQKPVLVKTRFLARTFLVNTDFCVDLFSPFILNLVNMSINSSIFSSVLNLADVTPVYKKDSHYQKSNYSSVTVPPNPFKIFENIFYGQITPHFEKKISKY